MAEVSVIVPVYNVEKYLGICIDSILNQSFTDYELILIDDGSTDSSGSICDDYAKKYPSVKVIHQENSGQAHARNVGVKTSCAEWIMFVDSDDMIHPQLLEHLYNAAAQDQTEISVCYRRDTAEMPRTFSDIVFSDEILCLNDDSLVALMHDDPARCTVFWVVYAKLIKKSVIESHMFTAGKIYEDNAVAGIWLTEAGRISVVPEYMYYYRDNPTGTMNAVFSPKKLDYLWALEELLRFYESCGYQKMQVALAREYIWTAVWLAERVKKELNDPVLARRVIRGTLGIKKQYREILKLSEEENRKLFKAAHPFLHRVRKKCKSVFRT